MTAYDRPDAGLVDSDRDEARSGDDEIRGAS